jgi:fructose-bisphosphate aldolase, class II
MPLVTIKEILNIASSEHYAVGGFNVANMEMIIGVISAAEELKSPVILQVAESRLAYSPLNLIGPSMVAAAESAKVPVAVNFDHGKTAQKIQQALEMGFSSIMIDGSACPLLENIRITNEIIDKAAQYGASVEAEIGAVGNNEDGTHADARYTDLKDAAEFYNAAKVDALAISIGNAHGMYKCKPHLNFEILSSVHKRLPVPLVLHGGSGLDNSDIKKSIDCGISKVNIATETFDCVEKHVHGLYQNERSVTYFDLHDEEIEGAYENVKNHILMFGSKGKA